MIMTTSYKAPDLAFAGSNLETKTLYNVYAYDIQSQVSNYEDQGWQVRQFIPACTTYTINYSAWWNAGENKYEDRESGSTETVIQWIVIFERRAEYLP